MFHVILHSKELDLAGCPSQRRTELVRAGTLLRITPAVFIEAANMPTTLDEQRTVRLHAELARLGPYVAVIGETAAAHWKLDAFPGHLVPLQVTIPHRRGHLPDGDVTVVRSRHWAEPLVVDGIPVASPVETLLTLGGYTTLRRPDEACRWPSTVPELVEFAVESALYQRLCTVDDLLAAVDATSLRRPGVAILAAILRRRGHQPPTESFFETRVLHTVRRGGLPEPTVRSRSAVATAHSSAVLTSASFGSSSMLTDTNGTMHWALSTPTATGNDGPTSWRRVTGYSR